MSMTWGDIFELFFNACGRNDYAWKERFIHVTEGYGGVISNIKDPEAFMVNASVDTVANQDWFEMDPDFQAIVAIEDKTTGNKLDPEPGGFRGRMRFYEPGQSRPPTAEAPSFWTRKGNRIYLRDTPDNIRTLYIAAKLNAPTLDETLDLSEHPRTPNVYDMAIVRWAVGSFYVNHPPITDRGLDLAAGRAILDEAKQMLLGDKRSPMVEEQLDTRHYMRQAGYDFGPGGR